MREVKLRQVERGVIADRQLVFFVRFDDGAQGLLTMPDELAGALIEWVHRANFQKPGNAPAPEFEVLRIGFGRDNTDRVRLRFATSQTHDFECILSADLVATVREKLARPEALPLLSFLKPN